MGGTSGVGRRFCVTSRFIPQAMAIFANYIC